ncbi:hypothetical protein PRO82_001516 [Candidatus Protochlamydia amoebophila]|nr:hypothetical protein [Candidatus Protochlamydia amoebophila]
MVNSAAKRFCAKWMIENHRLSQRQAFKLLVFHRSVER